MGCDIKITLGGVTYPALHSDAEVDAFIREHQSQISDELKNGFNKIFSLTSKDETISKLNKARAEFDSKLGVDKDTVSAGVTTLFDLYFGKKKE